MLMLPVIHGLDLDIVSIIVMEVAVQLISQSIPSVRCCKIQVQAPVTLSCLF